MVLRLLMILFVFLLYSTAPLMVADADISISNLFKAVLGTAWSVITVYAVSFLITYAKNSACHWFKNKI